MISETKLDEISQPYRMDRNGNGNVIVFLVREDIPSRQICFKNNDKDIEHLVVEINLCKKKWLTSCSYDPHLQFIDKCLAHIENGLDSFSKQYDNYILRGNFNVILSNNFVDIFCGSYSLKKLY